MPYDPGLFLPSPNVDLLLFLSINYVDVIVKLCFSDWCLKKLSIMLRITLKTVVTAQCGCCIRSNIFGKQIPGLLHTVWK